MFEDKAVSLEMYQTKVYIQCIDSQVIFCMMASTTRMEAIFPFDILIFSFVAPIYQPQMTFPCLCSSSQTNLVPKWTN